jgi:hypothetical protein
MAASSPSCPIASSPKVAERNCSSVRCKVRGVAFHARLEGGLYQARHFDPGSPAGDRQARWRHQHHRHQPIEPRRPASVPGQGSGTPSRPAELPLVARVRLSLPNPRRPAWRISVCQPELAAALPRSDANGAIPLAYTVRDTIADAEQAIGVYVAYRPQRLVFDDAADHPTQLVESAAMASVALPAPSYVPQLPAKVIRDRVLSRAQLERWSMRSMRHHPIFRSLSRAGTRSRTGARC